MKKKYQRLPDAELDIMLILWHGSGDMSRSEIETEMNKKRVLASTTILSLLSRLEKRGVVSVKREKNKNLYSYVITQEEYQTNESNSILGKLYDNSLKKFATALYQEKKITAEEIEGLKSFIEQMEERRG